VVARFGAVVTGRVYQRDLLAVRADPSVASMKATRRCAPHVVQAAAAPAPLPRAPRATGATGRGVYIGSVDWGFDFAHVNLRDARGRTRIARLWDQRARAGVSPFGYGREIDRDAIDCALTAADPYAALDYDPADADADGTGTHGTHVIDIAAGSGRAPGSQPGIAPDADLLLVHLRGSDTRPT